MSSPFKPAPLAFSNSPRQSPFRRPGSVSGHSPSTVRPATPGSSPLKPRDTPVTPSQANLRSSVAGNPSQNPPSWLTTRGTSAAPEPPASPTRSGLSPVRNLSASSQDTLRPSNTASLAARFDGPSDARAPSPAPLPALDRPAPLSFARSHTNPTPPPATRPAAPLRTATSDSLSKLPAPLLHSMRESFSVLDRSNSGAVSAADVSDMLSQLGLSATPAQLATYFPSSPTVNLATYLATLSDLFSALSHPSELSAAFEAFDDADDGQIDLVELKDALMHTPPEPGERKLTEREIESVVEAFSGRRAFGKGGKGLGRGEVFRWQEFMAGVMGGKGEGGTATPV